MTTSIGECGHPISLGAKVCRTCWLKARRKEPKRCLDCGTFLNKGKHGGLSLSTRCWPCHRKWVRNIHPCPQCGKPRPRLKGSESIGQLCRECWHNRPRKERICQIPDCGQKHQAKGLCLKHYKIILWSPKGRARSPMRNATPHQRARLEPCAACGFKHPELSSHAHRIVPNQGYTEGNLVPLCARCHELVTKDLIPLPDIRF